MDNKMTFPRVPDADNIARLCKPKHIEDGLILATAFLPRINESYLSVNWLECIHCEDRNRQIEGLKQIYSLKFSVPKKARISVLNVGRIKNIVTTDCHDKKEIEVLHKPEENDKSHSGIFNIDCEDIHIAELIISTISDENIYMAV